MDTRQSTAFRPAELPQRFRVTHPFHPWYGRTYVLLTYRHNWGENRVYFHDEDGRLIALPAQWTSVVPPDPFVVVSRGRSAFRLHDLVELAGLLNDCERGGR